MNATRTSPGFTRIELVVVLVILGVVVGILPGPVISALSPPPSPW